MINKLAVLQAALNRLASEEITKIALPLRKLVTRNEYPPDLSGSADISEHYPWLKDLPGAKDINFDKFLSDNIKDLNIIDDFADGKYRKLGSGGEGTAYQIGGRSLSDPASYVLKIQHSTNVFEDPEQITIADIDSLHKGDGDKDLTYQPMIYANGVLYVTWIDPLTNRNELGIFWWKIMEKVKTDWWRGDPTHGDGYLVPKYRNHIRRVLFEITSAMAGNAKDPTETIVVIGDELGLSNSDTRKHLADSIESSVKNIPHIALDLSELSKALKPGWLSDFIASYLFQVGVKRRRDFAPQNFGIREGTGTIIWFDA